MVGANYVLLPATGSFHYSTLGKIVHACPKRNSNGGSSVLFMVETKYGDKKLYFQTPRLRAPFGRNNFKRDDGRDNLSVQLAVDRDAKDGFMEMLRSLDEAHKSAAEKNGATWFSKSITKEAIDHLYKPSLIEPKDPKYGPTIRLKINNASQFYNELEELKDSEILKAGSEVVCIVECNTLWFVNQSFQPSYTIVQAQVFNAPANPFEGFSITHADNTAEVSA